MERLLTGAVTRMLRKFIRSAGDTSGSELRATLSSTGSVVLHNLELDLSSLLDGGPLYARRAFAQCLTLTIRWASLTIQARLPASHLPVSLFKAPGTSGAQPSTGWEALWGACRDQMSSVRPIHLAVTHVDGL